MVMSLRLRLFVIILLPLMLIGVVLGMWRIDEARKTTEGLYDRNLVFTAVAIARDISLIDGDALSRETEVLLSNAAGGPIRYHVYAPDGVFVTGYARPPIPIGAVPKSDQPFAHFDAVYRDEQVRVLRLWDVSKVDGLSGIFTITVWQEQSIRQRFVRALAMRAITLIVALIGTVAVALWFGVNLGLKPLLDLEDAISQRSPKDLTPIRRKVPQETRGIVEQLNQLIGKLDVTIEGQNNFISDAAHQLRNPLAGIHALAESILTAKSLPIAKSRANDLIGATQHASKLANRLLRLERIQAQSLNDNYEKVDLAALVLTIVQEFKPTMHSHGVTLTLDAVSTPAIVIGDAVMLGEAITNLLDNALAHGGSGLSTVTVNLSAENDNAVLRVTDNGVGVAAADIPKVMARFGQADPGEGSGLGLPIAEAVASRHGGSLKLVPQSGGLSVCLSLPLA